MNDRAEQAFRDAFAEHGGEPMQSVRPRWRVDVRWAVAAVIAMIVIAVPLAFYQGSRGEDLGDPVAATPITTQTTEVAAGLSGLAAPKQGWKWVSRGDVAVQVPQEWNFSDYLRPDWCAWGTERPTRPEGPYVAMPPGLFAAILREDVGPEFVRMHVAFTAPTEGIAATKTLMQAVGSSGVWVILEVDAKDDDRALAEEILVTAVTFERDFAGCVPDIPFTSLDARPEPWDIATAEGITGVGVCRYTEDSYVPGSPNLDGSRLLDATDGAELISGIAGAPTGVSGDPNECAGGYGDRSGVVLRVAEKSGVHDVYLRVEGCRNLGWDDGANRRTLTSACRPVFAIHPIRLDLGSKEAAENCLP